MLTSRRKCLAAFLVTAWAVSGAILGAGAAGAHAVILSAEPAVDAVVHSLSVPVVLRFHSRIDHARSRLTLIRPDGSSTVLALKDASRPDILAATIEGLAPGSYRLRWQVLAIDGHITRGDIPFKVAP